MDFYLDTLLNFPDVTVESCIQNANDVHLTLRLLNEKASCTHCGETSEELHQSRQMLLRDLPIFGQPVYLKLPRRQFYCQSCQRYFTESLSFMDGGRRYTLRYEDYIFQQVHNSSVKHVSRAEGLTSDRVQGIISRQQTKHKLAGKKIAAASRRASDKLAGRTFNTIKEVETASPVVRKLTSKSEPGMRQMANVSSSGA